MKDLDKESFEKEVIKSKIPVIVDFYADWCVSTDTQIYSSSLNSKIANQINENDSVLSFNNGLTRDEIIRSKTSNKEGHCKCIVTTTGRMIETTNDHAFFTKRGWIQAQELNKDDEVAVLPVVEALTFEGNSSILLNKNNLDFFKKEYKNLNKFLVDLTSRKLLPLYNDDKRLLILARLIGALFSDGSLYQNKKNNYREISFSLGQKKDVDDLITDLKNLGFNKVHVSEKESECNINGRRFTMHTFRVKCLSTALYLLLQQLGVPEGNKTNQNYDIPQWIKNSHKALKKEFLAGYLGGDGPKITINIIKRKEGKQPYNSVHINDLEFRKRTDLINNGINFGKSIISMLQDFGMSTNDIFYEIDPYIRKDGTQTAIIHIRIKNNINNGFILGQNIGYAYCWQKQINAHYTSEFLRELLRKRSSWKLLYEKAINLSTLGFDYKKISEIIKIPYLSAYNWIKKGVKPSVQKHHSLFHNWLEKATIGLKDGLVWERIENIWEVFLLEVQVITTKKHHNFIANGFLVHNCGPCKMMAPTFEKLSRDFEGKINFFKLNVDNNEEISSEYSVMSIPTLIIFKDGKEVDRMVGAQGEDQLKKKLQIIIEEVNKA